MKIRPQRILITGGAGFIGSHLVQRLHSAGCEVVVVDALTEQVHGRNPEDSPLVKSIAGKAKIIRCDIASDASWLSHLEGGETLIHLAAETGTGQSMYEVERYTSVNVSATAQMVQYIMNLDKKPSRMILASSRAIYGEGSYNCATHGHISPKQRKRSDMDEGIFDLFCPNCEQKVMLLPSTERTAIAPTSIYGATKYAQESIFLLGAKAAGVPSIALRFQNVYGPGQSLFNPYTGLLAVFCRRLQEGKDLEVFEDGLESRDFVFIDDVVDSILLALGSETSDIAINIGSGQPTTILDVAKILSANYGGEHKIKVTGAYRLGDIRHSFADISGARSILGYSPSVSLEQGLARFVSWAKRILSEQVITGPTFEDSMDELRKRGLAK